MSNSADNVFQRVLARERQRIGELERSVEELAAELQRVQAELQRVQAEPARRPEAAPKAAADAPPALRQELAAAQAANKAKTMFLAQMSHELRIPLNGLVGAIDVLARSQLDESQRRLVEICQQSNVRVLRLIGDVLDFSRIETGRLELAAIPFCVQELVTELADLFAQEARGRGLKFHLAVPAEPLVILRGDPNRLGQILSNLLHNACKFTPNGSISLRVEFPPTEGGRQLVRWSVVDTGIGIPEGEQARLFDAFAQAANAATRKHSGAGLGLSIVKSLAEAMGGIVRVQSNRGRARRSS